MPTFDARLSRLESQHTGKTRREQIAEERQGIYASFDSHKVVREAVDLLAMLKYLPDGYQVDLPTTDWLKRLAETIRNTDAAEDLAELPAELKRLADQRSQFKPSVSVRTPKTPL